MGGVGGLLHIPFTIACLHGRWRCYHHKGLALMAFCHYPWKGIL